MTVYVNADELIVGNQAQWPKASPIYPEYSTDWLEAELNGTPFFPDKDRVINFTIPRKIKTKY